MSQDDQQLVRVKERERIERSLGRLDRLARLMDDQFELPIVKYKIGLDPLIGLIPGGGDWVTWFVSLYILLEALRLRVPSRVLFGIGWNITADLLLGYVPGVGDLADVAFKANRRSVRIIFDHFEAKPKRRTPEVIDVPETALDKPKSGAERWLVGLLLVALFTALAAVPLVALWWWLNQ
jgi:hypothetical protein